MASEILQAEAAPQFAEPNRGKRFSAGEYQPSVDVERSVFDVETGSLHESQPEGLAAFSNDQRSEFLTSGLAAGDQSEGIKTKANAGVMSNPVVRWVGGLALVAGAAYLAYLAAPTVIVDLANLWASVSGGEAAGPILCTPPGGSSFLSTLLSFVCG